MSTISATYVRDLRLRRGIRRDLETIAAEATAGTGVTGGTAEASKTVVLDASANVAGIGTLGVTNLDAGKSGTAGSVDVFPATGSKGKLAITCANQDGNTTVTVQALGMAQASTVKIPDPGASTAFAVLGSNENDQSLVNATNAEIDWACDVSARVQTLTASGAITAGVQSVQLNKTNGTIAATIASAANHPGLFVVKAITEPGEGGDHTVTLSAGTWNGTNTVATFADINDALAVYFDSAGNGTVLVNVGSVALS